MNILAFDCSLHATGWALFLFGELNNYGVLKVPAKYKGVNAFIQMAEMITFEYYDKFKAHLSLNVVTEYQKHRGPGERAKPNDLMLLQSICLFPIGLFCGYSSRYWYTPSQWKGSIPKKIHNERVKKKFNLGDLDNNILDAIGIGDYHYGRCKKLTS